MSYTDFPHYFPLPDYYGDYYGGSYVPRYPAYHWTRPNRPMMPYVYPQRGLDETDVRRIIREEARKASS